MVWRYINDSLLTKDYTLRKIYMNVRASLKLWVIFRVKLTDFRVIVDPEWSLAPMDPFPGHADPGVFRVYTYNQRI